MGKSKSRILRKGVNNQISRIAREDAVKLVVECLEKADIKEAKHYITLFCMSAEEILEAGASYETVVAIKNIFT